MWRSGTNAACTECIAYSVALAAGRYRWHLDQVLTVGVKMVQQKVMILRKRGVEKEEETHGREVLFVKEG